MAIPSSSHSAVRAAACIFSFWSPSAVHPQTGEVVEASGCKSVDLSSLSTQVHHTHSCTAMQHTPCYQPPCSAQSLMRDHADVLAMQVASDTPHCFVGTLRQASEVRAWLAINVAGATSSIWVLVDQRLRHLGSEHQGGLGTQRHPSLSATPHDEHPCR
jgi:hypothetical protein